MNLKEMIKQMIEGKEKELDEVKERSKKSESVEELRSLNEDIDKIINELNDLKAAYAKADEPADPQPEPDPDPNGERKFDPLGTYEARKGNPAPEKRGEEDPHATMEYRKAFMEYVQRGTMSSILEKRVDASVQSSDLGVTIPTTVMNQVIKDVEGVYGQLYSRVKKTNLKGGVKYPIGKFGATFKRITETTVSEKQKGGQITGSVDFTYKIGEIRLATTLLASVLSVPAFETEFSKVIAEAYVKQMDTEILIGKEESNEMVGIITEAKKGSSGRIPTKNVITFTADEMKSWDTWQKKLFSIVPLSIRKERPAFYLTVNTFESNLKTLKDSNGQPIAREVVNLVDGNETARFNGREVVLIEPTEDGIEDFNTAGTGDYFGMYAVLDKAYAINGNLQFSVRHYFDEDTNEYIDKAIVINDGKPLDTKYIYLFKKGA